MRSLFALLVVALPFLVCAEVVVPIDSVKSHVNIRMSADPQSEIVGRLDQGAYLPLVASIDDWHEVEIAGGATGFIAADWTVVLASPPEEGPDADEADEPGIDIAADQDEDVDEAVEKVDGSDVGVPAIVQATTEHITEAAAEIIPAAESMPEPDESIEETTAEVARVEVVDDIPAVIEDPADVSGDDALVVPDDSAAEDLVADAGDNNPAEDTAAAAADETMTMLDKEAVLAVDDKADVSGVTPGQPEPSGVTGPQGPQGEPGPPGPAGAASLEGSVGYLARFTAPTIGGSSQVYDDGNNIGIGTTEPKQRLEVNGNIQIHERNSSVAGLMITQSDGDTGYIMHNRASTLTIGAGSVDRITINRDGNVGFGVARPANPIEMASGAHVTAGGVWTNSSSRIRKENITSLTLQDALTALIRLEPVQFNYKNDRSENYVGFIAEDVPELVATRDRDGLSSMDIVAVLTKVVQEQQKKIAELEARLDQR